jgi:apolipoprotein D and lipocalin family protein
MNADYDDQPSTGSQRADAMRTMLMSLLACFSLACIEATAAQAHLHAVPQLDLARYAGTWYEIAKYPNRYQAMCIANTTATYSIRPDATVEVQNRCRLRDGGYTGVTGTARRVGPSGSAQLEVRFAPAWLSWMSAVWAPYWVFDIDDDYSLAAVGQPGYEYLWILSRTPTVPPARYQALLTRIAAAGYDVTRLEATPQP